MKRLFIVLLLVLSLVFNCFAVDTIKTRAELVAIFGDNVAGDISAQDLRDYLISVHLMSDLDQVVTVAKAGGQYTTIQAGIDSISDAASDKIYTVLVYPGEYDEAITLSNYVNIVAIDPEATKILQQVTDNNAECHCYLNITIESASGYGIYPRHANSDITIDGNISSSSEGIYMDNGILTINGNISSAAPNTLEAGTLTINGNVTCSVFYALLINNGTLTINNGIIQSTQNNLNGHGVNIGGGTVILQNVKIVCTHADAKSIYAASAKDVYCMGVWANRDDDNNITQKITGGFTHDTDVQ